MPDEKYNKSIRLNICRNMVWLRVRVSVFVRVMPDNTLPGAGHAAGIRAVCACLRRSPLHVCLAMKAGWLSRRPAFFVVSFSEFLVSFWWACWWVPGLTYRL